MEIQVNGTRQFVPDGARLWDVRARFFPGADVIILNGFQTGDNLPVCEKDAVTLIKKGEYPDEAALSHMLAARLGPGVYKKFKGASVGVAGLGGVGSAVAMFLARSSVGRLVLADFDVVEPSNLNRQHYFLRHLGMAKADAIRGEILQANPYVSVEAAQIKLTEKNSPGFFQNCQVVCEAFDDAAQKAMLTGALLRANPSIKVVATSGMAGLGSANAIKSRRAFSNLYVCGDETAEAGCNMGLFAPRVSVCAGHAANAVLRILLGLEDV